MSLKHIRQCVSRIPSMKPLAHGPEPIFTTKIKDSLFSTNFDLLGEELMIRVYGKSGQTDLWLMNTEKYFLLSLELKVGKSSDTTKRTKLNKQVIRYTSFMKFYFPDNYVYGLGAYRCTDINKIIFTDYSTDSNLYDHTKDISLLKKIIEKSY